MEEFEYIRNRLQDTLKILLAMDDAIHEHLSDAEYEADTKSCEEYNDKIRRAIQEATRIMDSKLPKSTSSQPSQSTPTPVSNSVKLPPIKLEPFTGDIETWMRFWEQFESSVDSDTSLSTINKHVFLRGYLGGEPKALVDGISISALTYEETKRILKDRYGDRSRIIQAHLDFIENLQPIHITSPEYLNSTFIEYNQRIHALRALGEDVNAYGGVLAPKILQVFPEDLCRRWIIHAKREKLSEGDILKLMEFIGDEVYGALVGQKI